MSEAKSPRKICEVRHDKHSCNIRVVEACGSIVFEWDKSMDCMGIKKWNTFTPDDVLLKRIILQLAADRDSFQSLVILWEPYMKDKNLIERMNEEAVP